MTTDRDVQEREWERAQAGMFGWDERRIDEQLPVLFTDREWAVMLSDPSFGYVCEAGHRMRDADRYYGACLTCEGEMEAAYDEMYDNDEQPHPDEPYCNYCESAGHSFNTCPQRDDEPF